MIAQTKVADLTVGELRNLIQEVVKQIIIEMLGDPDQGLELQQHIVNRLQRSLATTQSGRKNISAQEAASKLGLEW
jgi:hypothetical protein